MITSSEKKTIIHSITPPLMWYNSDQWLNDVLSFVLTYSYLPLMHLLTHCGLVMPCGFVYLDHVMIAHHLFEVNPTLGHTRLFLTKIALQNIVCKMLCSDLNVLKIKCSRIIWCGWYTGENNDNLTLDFKVVSFTFYVTEGQICICVSYHSLILWYWYDIGLLFTKKMLSYRHRNPHYKPKMVWWQSQVYNGNPYINNTVGLLSEYRPRAHLNIKILSDQYSNSHYKDKTVLTL